MSENVERLSKKRSVIRNLTTKILEKIEDEIKNGERTEVEKLEELIDQLSIKEPLLKELDDNIELEISDSEEFEEEITRAQKFQERIVLGKGKANRIIRREKETSKGSSVGHSSQAMCTVKLPRLTIEKFNGDPLHWQGFWDQFVSAVHDNATLSKIDKFSYLKSYLGGNAASAVNGLTLSADNYDSAVEILTERFGRKDIVLNAHMNKLMNLSPVNSSSEVRKLRNLYDSIEIHIRSLAAMGLVSDSYGSMLCPILLKLIPEDMTIEFSRRQGSKILCDVMELVEFLKVDIECRERALLLSKTKTNEKEHNEGKQNVNSRQGGSRKFKWNVPTASTLAATVSNTCIFCDKDSHVNDNCTELSVDERKAKLAKLGRCFICLGQRHLARYCKRKKPCLKCKRFHHVTICTDTTENKSNEATERDVIVTTVAPEKEPVSGKDGVLLQTATCVAMGNGTELVVRCLFDGGSQQTFIKEDVSRSLKLPVISEETMSIHTFGGNKTASALVKRVKVKIKSAINPKVSIDLEALEIPEICNSTMSVPSKKIRDLMHEKGLHLADCLSPIQSTEITLLIGSDFYWKIVCGRVVRLSESLVATETKLGWCIQGAQKETRLVNEQAGVFHAGIQEVDVSNQLRSFWELESLGIEDGSNVKGKESSYAVMENFESSIKFKEGRYEAKLPWIQNHEFLPKNLNIAEKGFNSSQRKFEENPELYKLVEKTPVREFYSGQGIKWKFIMERAPWRGGFWERLVKSVKTCLKKILGKSCLSFEEFSTVLAEVESVLNSKPITYLYNEADEQIPLTPAHFLTENRTTLLPHSRREESKTNMTKRENMVKRLRYRERLMDKFWTRWRNKYLLELRSAHFRNQTESHNVSAGDIVLLKNEKLPRHLWQLGRVLETFTGRDGKIRACVIKLPGNSKLKRPIQICVPFRNLVKCK